MSARTAARLGLEEAWSRQIPLPGSADSIVDQQVVVHETDAVEYVEVVGKASEGNDAPVLYQVSTNQAGPDGQPIGKEEAERLARREVRRLKRRYPDAEIRSTIVPRVRLYTIARNGTLECRNAETGSPIWITQVGDYRLHYGKMGINDEFVTVTNGGNLIKVDATNGNIINSVRTTSIPLYGALNVGKYALVPTINNRVEGYPLPDTTLDPIMKSVSGMSLVPPTKAPGSKKIAWATNQNFVFVMDMEGEPSINFRLGTDGNVNGRIAAADGERFFFACESGQIYGLRATRTGQVLWSQPFGDPFYESPFLIDGLVLVPSAYGNLFAVDQVTGRSVWDTPTPNVERILGGFDHKLYVKLQTGSFGAIDLKTGDVLAVVPSLRPEAMLVNRITDRLYLVNSRGAIQCLRTIGHVLPSIRKETDTAAEETSEENPDPATQQPKPTENNDPFQQMGDQDPFGGAGMGGGDNDPFGTPAGGGGDPFADPFGGG